MLFIPTFSSIARGWPGILGIALIGTLAQATPSHAGEITLYGILGDVKDPDNDSNSSCTIKIPELSVGRSFDVPLHSPDSGCYGLRVESIEMSNMPAATQVLLTDDYFCDTTLGFDYDDIKDPLSNKNYWIKLRTSAKDATLANANISSLNRTGFLANTASGKAEISKNILLEDFKINGTHDRMSHTLSCIRITRSGNKATKYGPLINLPAKHMDIKAEKESESESLYCPGHAVMKGRMHLGDENGPTTYNCVEFEGVNITFEDWSNSVPECGTHLGAKFDEDKNRYKTCKEQGYSADDVQPLYFSCPPDEVMVGRSHKGDENADTFYLCAALYQGATDAKNRVTVWPGAWSGKIKENNSNFTCPGNQVLVGRAHEGDENDDTQYQCATLRVPAN